MIKYRVNAKIDQHSKINSAIQKNNQIVIKSFNVSRLHSSNGLNKVIEYSIPNL